MSDRKLTIDDLAAFMAIAERKPHAFGSQRARVSDFNDADVFLANLDNQPGRLYVSPDYDLLLAESGKFDVAILSGAEEHLFSLQRIRRVSASETRGETRGALPFMCKMSAGIVKNDGSWMSADGPIFGSIDGWTWSVISTRHDRALDESSRIRMAINIAAQRKLDWTVSLSFGHLPGVRIPTDPTGIRELFRFRDVAPGKKRRDALVHWVSEHYRQSRKDEDALTYVREHLRGQKTFRWREMSCSVAPISERVQCSVCADGLGPFGWERKLGPLGGHVVVCESCRSIGADVAA